ncbi:MAG: tRNA uridine(34) 5-carboxymethylaminomethyl modification radical SAM/GNAT enzyme Elp3 [Candidatus Micrarchaeota archaeon]|nr:tRNA uridine(34) 5-carboxymethylaminomethyl modification radical SAM/GNAT enzyme Elp3 [Candidatus Micrarchaeota archaeon]
MKKSRAIKFIIGQLLLGKNDLNRIKKEASEKFGLKDMPKTSDIFRIFPKGKLDKETRKLLFRKPMRTASGVTPIAVMVKPGKSCRWNCIYCPVGNRLAPKSYTGYEPAARRARSVGFDPKKQVETRLMHYRIQGHPTDKCEIIIMGGTFLNMPKKYQKDFIKSIYDTLNGKKSKSLEIAKAKNEKARHRMIGLTLETRPDVCSERNIDDALSYGATRVELGVQHPDDKIYRMICRGHSVKEVAKATERLKDSGFKVCYHIMPGILGSNKKKDIGMMKKLFNDQRFKPDMLKIYPTLVTKGTKLYDIYRKGKYSPYSAQEASEVISEMYRHIPYYARIMRIQRDIPTNLLEAGVENSNLREMVERKAIEKEIEIKEIRFREPKYLDKKTKLMLFRQDYKASNGKEIFLSFEDEKRKNIFGFVRLRIPHRPFVPEIDKKTGLIRELHVYGMEAEIGKEGDIQHKGLGKRLLKEAEKIAKNEFGMKRLAVISGVGAREYYYRLGYEKDGNYVSRIL